MSRITDLTRTIQSESVTETTTIFSIIALLFGQPVMANTQTAVPLQIPLVWVQPGSASFTGKFNRKPVWCWGCMPKCNAYR